MFEILLPYIQVILSVVLVTAILLQKNEAGLGAGFGGGGNFSSTNYTRRGFEKIIFNATIIIAIIFALSAFIALVL